MLERNTLCKMYPKGWFSQIQSYSYVASIGELKMESKIFKELPLCDSDQAVVEVQAKVGGALPVVVKDNKAENYVATFYPIQSGW